MDPSTDPEPAMTIDRRTFLLNATAAGALSLIPRMLEAAVLPEAFTPAAMRSDLDLLAAAYGAIHPGLTRYLPTGGFAARVEVLKRWADRERSPGEFYLALTRLTAAVRCGHSFPNPNNQRRTIREALFAGRDRVPFGFVWIGGRMIVTGTLALGLDLPAGTEIRSVNGISASRMLRDMLPLTRADGANDDKRLAQLAVTGLSRYEAFDLYRPLLYPSAAGTPLRLAIRRPGGEERMLEAACLRRKRGRTARPGRSR